eukprot:1710255-Prymnesium_polylepis.1
MRMRSGPPSSRLAHCSIISATVVDVPVPGGPNMQFGTFRATPSTTATMALRCSSLMLWLNGRSTP